MSILGKKWVIRNNDEESDIIEKLLKNRQIESEEDRKRFFESSAENLHDPMLLKDMDKAVDRIKKAVETKEKVMIFGDYDVDGITATALLYDLLKKAGVDAHYTLPHREDDGYGLQDYFIEKFKKNGVNLIVTVDCGCANGKEVKLANELGLDVVITDHHSMPEKLPPALAIVNPKQADCPYPNKDLCGAGIAYKLLTALAPHLLPAEEVEEYLQKQLGIAALGTVADCMSLLSPENRTIVKEGLNRLIAGNHPGILSLMEEAGLRADKITSITIGYQIGPRINAAGRMDKPDHALELLLGNLSKATLLNQLNKQRQVVLEDYMKEAKAQVEAFDKLPNIIVIKSSEWKSGLLGLIASKVVDQYHRPTIAMQERDEEFVASMRSVNDFDITECMRREAGELFSAFGGHTMAGGFSLPKEKLAEFEKRVNLAGETHINADDLHSTLSIDCIVKPEELSFNTCERIKKLEPYGSDNPEPTLLVKNMNFLEIRPVGQTGEHLQMPLKQDNKTFKGIAFRFGQHLDKIDPALSYDIAFNLEINEWNGRKDLQLKIVDLKLSND